MENERWLLPEGIEEVLPVEAARLERLRREVLDLFSSWGYELVIPPFIEYLDSLLVGTGNDLDLQTFKLTDQLSGRLMGVRADMTPQVARIDTHHLRREVPTRLCYLGTVLHTRPDDHGGTRSPLQVGAELYGHAGIESDVESIRLMLALLQTAGVEGIYLDLGHVGVFRELMAQADLTAAGEYALFDLLQRKSAPEMEGVLAELEMPAGLRAMLSALIDLNGDLPVLDEAERLLAPAGEPVRAALENLKAVAEALRRFHPELPLHFDLGELRGYTYHTGMVFGAFIPGHGQAVAQGGRYDDIGRVFGHSRPATGFSADLRTLMTVASAPTPEVRGIFAPCTDDPALEQEVAALRARGERVLYALPGQRGGAAEMGCDRELVWREGGWQVAPRTAATEG